MHQLFTMHCFGEKPTHTDRYINFRLDHPLQHKKAAMKKFICRAKHFTSNETNYQEHMNRIQNNEHTLKNNRYPPALTARSQSLTSNKKMIESIFSGATILSCPIGKKCKHD